MVLNYLDVGNLHCFADSNRKANQIFYMNVAVTSSLQTQRLDDMLEWRPVLVQTSMYEGCHHLTFFLYALHVCLFFPE